MHSVQLWLVSPPLKCENHCVGFDFVSGTYFLYCCATIVISRTISFWSLVLCVMFI